MNFATPEKAPRPDPSAAPQYRLDASVDTRLNNALAAGKLSESERQDLDEKLELLAVLPCAQQKVVLFHFFKQGSKILRDIRDKGYWLERCIRYVRNEGQHDLTSASGGLFAEVLKEHCLFPDDFPKTTLPDAAPADMLDRIARSLRTCILANVPLDKLSQFYLFVVGNELAKYNATCPEEKRVVRPTNGTISERDHIELTNLFQMADAKTVEAKTIRCLGRYDYSNRAFGRIHQEAILKHADRAGYPLHDSATRSVPLVCERLLIEGFDVNESRGELELRPLHLAAGNANVEVVKVLLEHQADPNLQDKHGRTALYAAVQGAAQLRADTSDTVPQHNLHLETCRLLLLAGAEDLRPSAWDLAREKNLHELANIVRLHMRLATGIKERFPTCIEAIPELSKLQYETALFVANIFSKHSNVSAAGAPTELRALIASEFIQARDRVQRLGNQLAKKLKPRLTSRAIEALMELPPEAAEFALKTWKVEEVAPDIFRVPKDLNDIITRSSPTEMEDVPGQAELVKLLEDPERLKGRIRKWDSDRGFGFILQEMPDDEPPREMFVHRKNVLGSSLTNHIDLPENARVSYLIGEQDQKPRATEVFLLQEDGLPLPLDHMPGCPNSAHKVGILSNEDADGPLDEQDLSQMFIKYLRSGAVQDQAKEPRARVDSYLRCIGVSRFSAARRDDQIWKAERNLRIDVFFERTTAPTLKEDFDPRVRRLLLEASTSSSIARVSEALALIEDATSGRDREAVRNWPGYLVKLLKGFDAKNQEGSWRRAQQKAREDEEEAQGEAGAEVVIRPEAPVQARPQASKTRSRSRSRSSSGSRSSRSRSRSSRSSSSSSTSQHLAKAEAALARGADVVTEGSKEQDSQPFGTDEGVVYQ